MKTNLLPNLPARGLLSAPASAAFNLVLVHDREIAARNAREIIGRLLGICLAEVDIHRDEWSFAELAHIEFGREALELARPCDLFILATVDGAKLPLEITSWIARWMETRTKKDTALVCLVGSSAGMSLDSPVHQTLRGLGETSGLVFFGSGFILPESGTGPEGNSIPSAYFPRPEGWGINE